MDQKSRCGHFRRISVGFAGSERISVGLGFSFLGFTYLARRRREDFRWIQRAPASIPFVFKLNPTEILPCLTKSPERRPASRTQAGALSSLLVKEVPPPRVN